MTWKSSELSSSGDFECQPPSSEKSDLSAGIWKRDSGCSGGCCCGCCNRPDMTISISTYPGLNAPRWPMDSSLNQVPKWPLELGSAAAMPVFWPSLNPGDRSNVPYDLPSNDLEKNKTITVSNGDQLTLGGPNRFELVTKDGERVRIMKTLDSGAYDAPVEHVLSNGAIYRSRGGWNHDESIAWPNGDVVNFTDAGKFTSYEPHDENSSNETLPPVVQPSDSSSGEYTFKNGDRFITTAHSWELITASGQRVTEGATDPNSPEDATRIYLSNGATLISGGWGTDTIRYPNGESISFSKNGTLKSVNGEPV